MDFKKIVTILKKEKPIEKKSRKKGRTRSFKAAASSRFIDWIFSSRHKVNLDLQTQLRTIIQRSRDLSQNNQLFRSYLSNQQKSIVGSEGFRLQMQVKNADGSLNEALNKQIEDAWKIFGKKKNLQISQQLNDIDLDLLILRTLLIDGEVFIQIIKDADSQFGVKFKLLDSLAIATDRFQLMTPGNNGIFAGIEVDHNYKPIRYWMRDCWDQNYESGILYDVPASDIIHLYKPQFVNQVRGFSPIVASLGSLKQLDDFADAELIAAKVASCQGIFYERNDKKPNGDFLDQDDVIEDDEGTFLTELSPGIASVVPNGYNVKTLTPTHPNDNFDGFCKSISKRIGASLGSCYNKMNKDYSDVNYSSLKQANIDENNNTKSYQRFLIQNWKNIEFELFLKNYLINSKTELKPSQYYNYINSYRFIPKQDPYTDPSKEILAIERKLKLGLTSPIIELQNQGLDPAEVAKDFAKWKRICEQNGLYFVYDQKDQVESEAQAGTGQYSSENSDRPPDNGSTFNV